MSKLMEPLPIFYDCQDNVYSHLMTKLHDLQMKIGDTENPNRKAYASNKSTYSSLKNDLCIQIMELEIENSELKLELGSRNVEKSVCTCLDVIDEPVKVNKTIHHKVSLPFDEVSTVKKIVCLENSNLALRNRVKKLEKELLENQKLLNQQTITLNQLQNNLSKKSLEVIKLQKASET